MLYKTKELVGDINKGGGCAGIGYEVYGISV
jgi:hypothetical protein